MLRTGNIDTGPLLQAMMNERGASRHQQPSGTGGLPPDFTPLVSALMPQQQGAPTLPTGATPPITPMMNRTLADIIQLMNRHGQVGA